MESHVQLQAVNVNDILLNRYKVEEHLGGGGFSQVFSVKDLKTRQVLAMKVSGSGVFPANCKDDEFSNVEVAIREIRILKKLSKCSGQGKSLCALMTDWQYMENRMAILFERYPISVYDFMNNLERRPFVWENVIAISFQLVQVVKFLHENEITHMDIKPLNIMLVCADYKIVEVDFGVRDRDSQNFYQDECIALRNPEIKLIDFGSCLSVEDKGKPFFVGVTDEYTPPEFILKNKTSSAHDVWSVGCVILELYLGNPLFPECLPDVHLVLIQKIIGDIPLKLTKNQGLPEMTDKMVKIARNHHSLAELISWGPKDRIYLYELLKVHLLKTDPEERSAMADVLDHSFFLKTPNWIQKSMEIWQTPEIIGYESTVR